jgi:hypothetical protein
MTQTKTIVKIVAFALLCGIWSFSGSAQLNYDFTQGKFLIKGKVVDLRTQTPVSLANIKIFPSGKGVTCDNDGNFTMYVSKKDTLVFSSTGYIAKTIHVADLDSSKYYTLQIELLHDFIKLKEVIIYPFKDMDEFKKAFVDAKDQNKVNIPGLAPPKYSHNIPKAKFSNPISYLYERLKHRSVANPDFKP